MKTRKPTPLLAAMCAVLGVSLSNAQERPLLPYEAGETEQRIGLNSFGTPTPLPEVQSHEVRTPDFGPDIVDPPVGPRRYYVDIRYYGCRPWLIHPYTGDPIPRNELIRSVRTNNPLWAAIADGLTMKQLLEPRDELGGESLVSIEDGGMVDENNREAIQAFAEMEAAERANAADAGVTIPPGVNNITYAPYYGLYCLRVRICIPWHIDHVGKAYRYWLRWPYRPHQTTCWRHWWWYCWRNGPRGRAIYPCRPWLTPYTRWTRVGPDWVWHVSSVNRYRYWCLYGLRYYCTTFGTPVAINRLPYVGQLGLSLEPVDGITTDWLRPWPYPRWRYWPYRPYCTRWYWFRPIPWFNYRYLPPVVQCAYAIPKDGGGFQPGPSPEDDVNVFPVEPPNISPDDRLANNGDPNAAGFFGANFDIEMATTARPIVKLLGDHDGDGVNANQDNPRIIRIDERGHLNPIDLDDVDVPAAVIGN